MDVKVKKENKLLKRILIILALIVSVFAITSCTKSFVTNEDNADQLFNFYGNIYERNVDVSSDYKDDYDYIDDDTQNRTKLINTQNTNRNSLFSSLTNSSGYTTWFELEKVDANGNPDDFLSHMQAKVDKFTNDNFKFFKDGTLQSVDNDNQAKALCYHVAIYSGIEFDNLGQPKKVSDIWTNMNKFYDEVEDEIGIMNCPGRGYINTLQTTATNAYQSNQIGITPEDMTITQNGGKVFVQGKSWGQAFKDYGFLEGLFVYPLSCLAHYIITGLDMSGWAVLLAIFVITLLVRSITIVSTVFQSKTQAKQNKIQPMINELKKKYPNSETDKQEKQALAMEQAQLMKKAKMHPFLPMLFMIIQFPLFICVWSALQGSVAIAGSSFLGLSLTTKVSTCFTQFGSTNGAIVGIFIFILMTIANILSTMSSMWFNNWRVKKFNPEQLQTSSNGTDPQKMTKIMSYVMMAFIIFMGWSLPTGMGIYWFIGSIISIAQTLLTELLHRRERIKANIQAGGGQTLATMRRSQKHQKDVETSKKESKSDKPMWR